MHQSLLVDLTRSPEQLRPAVRFMRANYWNATSPKARMEILAAIAAFERFDAAHPAVVSTPSAAS